jgi:hypothetical protein
MDSRRIKLTPEVRYIRWRGYTFQGLTYRSSENQIQAGFGLSF